MQLWVYYDETKTFKRDKHYEIDKASISTMTFSPKGRLLAAGYSQRVPESVASDRRRAGDEGGQYMGARARHPQIAQRPIGPCNTQHALCNCNLNRDKHLGSRRNNGSDDIC